MEEKKMLTGWRKHEGNRPLGIPRRRWEVTLVYILKNQARKL
jgi:hypothetical protein